MDLLEWYADRNYKLLMLIPLAILLLSLGFLTYNYMTTGEPVRRSVDLKGGTQVTILTEGDFDFGSVQDAFETEFPGSSVRELGGGTRGLLVTVGDAEPEQVVSVAEGAGVNIRDTSFQQIGPALGEAFWEQSQMAFLLAFTLMAITVFIAFRTIVPSIAVIQAVITDIVGTLAVMQIVGIPLSLASFAGLLLTIGYSVDTDILLTERVIRRREGKLLERAADGFKTGLTMGLTAVGAMTALYLATSATVLQEVTSVLIIALLLDIPVTWLMNLGILRMWTEGDD